MYAKPARLTLVIAFMFATAFVPKRLEAQSVSDQPAKVQTTEGSSSSGFHGWQIEGHVGVIPGSSISNGTSSMPGPGPTFTTFQGLTSRFVPSWYFGDGALLANQVAHAIVSAPPPPIKPLDSLLTSASAERETGAAFGFRLGHSVTRHVLAELTVETGNGHVAITNDALTAIEQTRASFKTYFDSILARGVNVANISTSSTATVVNNTGTEIMTTGDVEVRLGSFGGFLPYATVGGGLELVSGASPSLTLIGTYSFTQRTLNRFNGAPFNEADRVLVRYNVEPTILMLVGGGVQRDLTAHTGFRADVRVYLRANEMSIRVDTAPQSDSGTPVGRIVRGPGPQIQISTMQGVGLPSSLSQSLTHVDTFRGSSQQIGVTFGYFLRF